jgi:hypothetical protein
MLSHEFLPFQNELRGNEVLLWSGRPRQGLVFRASDLFLVPFGLVWAGFVFFWELAALAGGVGCFGIWGIPFVLVGIYMTVGRFVVDSYIRRNTYYGLTNERVIVASGLLRSETKSLNLRTASDITMSQRANGVGTITFGAVQVHAKMYQGMHWPGAMYQMPPMFDLIPDVRRVYEMILEIQKAQ